MYETFMADKKPLVSFIIIAYKQEQFIREAIEGAFAQDYDPLEIIISDDCSPDRTYEIIEESASKYRGSHRIILNRNEKNLGISGHINRVFQLSHGDFIIASAGDDISVPERTRMLVEYWLNADSPVDLVSSYYEEIDENGKSLGIINKEGLYVLDVSKPVIKWVCGVTGACNGYSRKLFEKYGPLDTRIVSEDWVFPFRAWLEHGLSFIEEPLVKHRNHPDSVSIIHSNLYVFKNKTVRKFRRRQSSGDRLARLEDWYRSWKISGKKMSRRIKNELENMITLGKYEWTGYESNRLLNLRNSFLSIFYSKGNIKFAIKLFLRHVLRLY
jgi:glycosyltransferase involved in cell wall biosynthesis